MIKGFWSKGKIQQEKEKISREMRRKIIPVKRKGEGAKQRIKRKGFFLKWNLL